MTKPLPACAPKAVVLYFTSFLQSPQAHTASILQVTRWKLRLDWQAAQLAATGKAPRLKKPVKQVLRLGTSPHPCRSGALMHQCGSPGTCMIRSECMLDFWASWRPMEHLFVHAFHETSRCCSPSDLKVAPCSGQQTPQTSACMPLGPRRSSWYRNMLAQAGHMCSAV